MTSIYFAEFQYCWQLKERPIKQENNVDPSSKYSHVSHRTILADILRTDWILLQHNPHKHKQIVDSQQRKLYYLCSNDPRLCTMETTHYVTISDISSLEEIVNTQYKQIWNTVHENSKFYDKFHVNPSLKYLMLKKHIGYLADWTALLSSLLTKYLSH